MESEESEAVQIGLIEKKDIALVRGWGSDVVASMTLCEGYDLKEVAHAAVRICEQLRITGEKAAEAKPRLMYHSEGNDDITTPCDSVENAVHMFRADAESLMQDHTIGQSTITLSIEYMTDEEIEALEER